MIQFNDNTVAATGKEINDSGLFPHTLPNDGEMILWIKNNWNPSTKHENFAPIAALFDVRTDENTHKIKDHDLFFTLNLIPGESDYSFEGFINKFIEIERLNHKK